MAVALVEPKTDLSEQTKWMIAVRDHRDKDAFRSLFRFFAPRLRGMLARQGSPGNSADDIVQDVMLKVWQRADQFDPARASASAWIYRIARNRHIDTLRKAARPVPEALRVPEPPPEDPAAQLALETETKHLLAALQGLSPEQREIIVKVYFGELSHAEARDVTGLPLGTIKSRIRLALERLRHELKELRQT